MRLGQKHTGTAIAKMKAHARHGHARTGTGTPSRTWEAWRSMRKRCYLPTARGYAEYGGRGIIVCERWSSFDNFLADMGECPAGLSLDRINNNGNYEIGNCRWSTWKEQASNRRTTRRYELKGSILTVSELVELSGINRNTLKSRLRKRIPVEIAGECIHEIVGEYYAHSFR